MNELTIKLANEFSKLLSYELSDIELCEVIAKNDTPEYGEGICASHDYLDANEIMSLAFLNVAGKEIDLQNQSDIDLWSESWDLAKQNKFKILP